ncbi:MAG: nucleotidyl transferase AbiEii/AbiGii toxin family protein [Anaerolineae bacterium]|nr:nucleotidyl transferase AbiEii/AbiGii toxin family protein [Anaerolineae bacterium]
MDLLTPLQRRLLEEIGRSPLQDKFFLTGGTALAALYLHHRYSVDLDLFTEDPAAIPHVVPTMQEIASRLGLEITFTRTLGTFLEAFVSSADAERVEFDFALDSPYRLEPVRRHPELQIDVDNPTDIACNKLSALFDRAEPKDYVDVYFIVQELMPFERLVALARQKHIGMDDYWLALALAQVETVSILPRMVKPLSVSELKAFFLARAKEVMDRGGPALDPDGQDLRSGV